MPFGLLRRFVILLAVPPHSSRQLLCPSRHFVHYFLRSASLHLVRSYSFASRPGIPLAIHKATHKGMHQPFARQRYNTHWVPFRSTTSFTHFSSVQSTRCQIILLAGYPHFGCVHLATAKCSCRTSISQSIAKVHLHSSAASVPWREIYSGGFLWSWHRHSFFMALLPAPRGGSQPPSFVPLFGGLRRLASNATVRTSVPHGYASFLPQALLPAGLTH